MAFCSVRASPSRQQGHGVLQLDLTRWQGPPPLAPSERFPALASELNTEIMRQGLGIPEGQGGAMAGGAELEEVERSLAGLSKWQPIEAAAQPPPADTQEDDGAPERPAERSGRQESPARPSGRSQTDARPERAPSPRRNPSRDRQPNAQSNVPPDAPTGPSSWRAREQGSRSDDLPIHPDRLRQFGSPSPGMNRQGNDNRGQQRTRGPSRGRRGWYGREGR